MVVAFRRHARLPLDDFLYALQLSISEVAQFVCTASRVD